MDADERLGALGMLVINCAVAFQVSWIPLMLFLGGAGWMGPALAAALHRLAIAYLVAGPVAHGVALHRSGAEHDAFVQWAARGFAPRQLQRDERGETGALIGRFETPFRLRYSFYGIAQQPHRRVRSEGCGETEIFIGH